MFGDDTDRKTSATSFSSTSRDDSRDSSKSYSRRQSETGQSNKADNCHLTVFPIKLGK